MGKEHDAVLVDEKVAAELVGIAFDRHELAALGQQAEVVEKHLGVPRRQYRRGEAKRFVGAVLGIKEHRKGNWVASCQCFARPALASRAVFMALFPSKETEAEDAGKDSSKSNMRAAIIRCAYYY